MFEHLPPDVKAELQDVDYHDYEHGTRRCADLGCKGPLCLKFERDRKREARRLAAEKAGRVFRAHRTEHSLRDGELELILRWYRTELSEAREQSSLVVPAKAV